jgi:hypothetical protein
MNGKDAQDALHELEKLIWPISAWFTGPQWKTLESNWKIVRRAVDELRAREYGEISASPTAKQMEDAS